MKTAALPNRLRRARTKDQEVPDAPARASIESAEPFTRKRLFLRAAPFLGAGLLPFATVPLPPQAVSPGAAAAAAALSLAIALTVLLAPWHRLPHFAGVVPPIAYFIVIALLREGEAGATGYAPLAMLPVFWLALYGTRGELAIAIAGVAATFLAPLLLVGPPDYPTSEWRRAVLWIAIAPLVGYTVQRLVRQLRERAAESARRADALRRSEEESQSMVATMARVTEAMQAISRETDGSAARSAICAAARAIADADVASLLEPDDEGNLVVTATLGGGVDAGMKITIGQEPSGAAVAHLSRRPFFVDDGRGHAAVSQRLVHAAGGVSLHFEPVLRDEDSIGVLVVGWNEPVAEVPDVTCSGLRILAAEAAIAIERAELLGRLEVSARTDDLTGLPNRRAWDEQLPRELARARREGRPVCVAMLDLDRFKRFNDRRGHQAGDRLLKQSAAAWAAHLRTSDMLARYGGEEFSVVLPGCTLADARVLVERLRGAMPEAQTVSAGVAYWDGLESAESLVGRADTALYEAKKTGRDRLIADDSPAAIG